MPNSDAQQLLGLLVEEREAIIEGTYERVTDLSERKVALLTGLRRSRHSAEVLREIASQIDRNQALLAAAIRGISSARERLVALAKVKDTLSVYDKSGNMAQVPLSRPGLEKKA